MALGCGFALGMRVSNRRVGMHELGVTLDPDGINNRVGDCGFVVCVPMLIVRRCARVVDVCCGSRVVKVEAGSVAV